MRSTAFNAPSPPAPALLSEAQRLIEAGRLPAARRTALALLAQQPELTEAWLLLALAEQRLQRHDAMLAAAQQAVRLQPDNVAAALKLIEALLLCGQGAEARSQLAALEQRAQHDAALLTALAGLYTQAGAHQERLRCAQRALAVAPDDPARLASCAAAETACGLIADAEQHLDRLLEREPQDFGSYYRRSILRRQLPDHNHIEPMTRLLARLPADAADSRRIVLCAGEGVRGPGALRGILRLSAARGGNAAAAACPTRYPVTWRPSAQSSGRSMRVAWPQSAASGPPMTRRSSSPDCRAAAPRSSIGSSAAIRGA